MPSAAAPHNASSSSGCRPRKRISDILDKKKGTQQQASGRGGGIPRMSSAQVDEAWRALLEETLPADKREALQESYDAETDPQTRYNMLLEFSSYLRQTATNHTMGGGDGSEDPYAVPRRGGVDAPPGFGRPREIYDDDDTSLCWEIVRVLLIVGAILGAVIGGAWWLSKSLEAGSPEALTINDGRELQDSEHE